MLENLGLFISALCTLYGSVLLYDATTSSDISAGFRILGGAIALAAGLITAALVLKSKLQWRRIQKQNRPRS